ncbi:hypothetical protein AGMMS4957_16300 [Bacteroidia bacterium]|nr:hypothetical protein AGMMS4957_16300 [Bacteroidia bacterium]
MDVKEFEKLLKVYEHIPKTKRRRTFMEFSGYSHYENVCSNILQFFLDSENEHGLGNLVFNALLRCIPGYENDSERGVIEVNREESTDDGGRLDLLIHSDRYVVGIENKIRAGLYNDLKKYRETVEKAAREKEQTALCVVLSLNAVTDLKIKENRFVNVTYKQLFEKIRSAIGEHITSGDAVYINHLAEFMKTINNLKLQTMEENKKLWAFFKDNKDAVSELSKKFNEFMQSIHQKVYILEDELSKNFTLPECKHQVWKEKDDDRALIHDFEIDKYKIYVNVYSRVSGWEVIIGGRNPESTNYLFNTIEKRVGFLRDDFEKEDDIIYTDFNADKNISELAQEVFNILQQIDTYKKSIK